MKKYESDCGTRSSAKHLMFVSLYIYLILMTALYSLEFANFNYAYAGCLIIFFWSIVILKLENTQEEDVGDLLKALKIKRGSIKEERVDLTSYEKKKMMKKNINLLKEAYRNPNYNMW